MKLNSKLLRGKTPEARQELEARYKNARELLKEIERVLTADLENAIIRDEVGDYSCPNLLPKLADNAGYRRALREAIALIQPSQDHDPQ